MIGRHPLSPAQKRAPGETSPALETGRNRLVIAAAMFAAAFTAIGLRLVDVTVLKEGDEPAIARTAAPPWPRSPREAMP